MTTNEILKRLDLKLGMKVIDTKPSECRRCKDPIHTLVKNSHNGFVFEGSTIIFEEGKIHVYRNKKICNEFRIRKYYANII